ncbi:uncharacterized protein LOC119389978 isoform X2 [Rhipicephalus sanguineus]|uniref:uncharacterized protein LOC119389978 isoform X2 n=1 Tax=Rhipicephalus sanguineus TaxID=34632 RepID=UPI0020C4C711|nr:uncharacterized protein LOC119389978 isoform X2 [Rhipicephalus sanguineus]
MFSSVPRCACSAQFNFLTIPWINPFQVQVYGATNAEEEQAVRASRCIYSVLLQLLMWSFHVVPKAVTGLLPLVDGPLLGIMTTGSIAPEYLSEPVLSLALTLMLLSAVEQGTDLVPRLSLTLCARFGLRRRAPFAFVCCLAFLGATIASGAALALPLMWITDRVLEFLHVEQLDRPFLLQTPSSDRRTSKRSLDSLTSRNVRDAETLLTQLATEARGDPKRVSPVRRHSDSLGQHRQCRSSSLAEDVGHTADQHGRNVAVGWFSGNATVDARRRSRLPGSFSHLLLLLLRLEPVAVRAQRSGGERCRADGGQDTTETSEHAYTWENQATAMEAEALRQLRCINVPYALRRICAVRLSRRLMVGMTIKVVLIASVLLFTSTTGPLLPALANAVDVHTLTSKSTTAMPAVNYSFLSY